MTKTEMLLIRACKSLDPKTRLRSVYRKQYYGGECTESDMDMALLSIVTTLVDNFTPTNCHKFLSMVIDADEAGYPRFMAAAYIIRFTKYKDFPEDMIWKKRCK